MKRRDFFKIVATVGRGRRRGRLPAGGREDPAARGAERSARPRRRVVVRHRVPRVSGRLRRPRAQPRRARGQARGQSRPSGEPGRAVRARPGGAAARSTIRTASPARSGATATRCRSRRLGRGAQDASSDRIGQARAAGKGRGDRRSSRSSRPAASARSLDRWTQALGDAAARRATSRSATRRMRAANRAVFGRDASRTTRSRTRRSSLSFGADFLETWISNVGYARGFARDARVPRGPRGHVHPRRAAPVAHRVERRRVGPQRAGHRGAASRSRC